MKPCPHCRHLLPEHAQLCVCGYSFSFRPTIHPFPLTILLIASLVLLGASLMFVTSSEGWAFALSLLLVLTLCVAFSLAGLFSARFRGALTASAALLAVATPFAALYATRRIPSGLDGMGLGWRLFVWRPSLVIGIIGVSVLSFLIATSIRRGTPHASPRPPVA